MRVLVAVWLLLAASLSLAAIPVIPADPPVSVELTLSITRAGDGKTPPIPSAALTLHNIGQTDLTLQHPGNRMALAFLVLDESGLPVTPRGIAKVDPAFSTIALKPGAKNRVEIGALQFLSQGALFAYELTPGHTYRVIAVYRPDGENSAGICSREVLFKFE